MPARPVESRPGSTAYVHTRVPGEVKNLCVTAARAAGLSVNAWAANVLRLAALDAAGFPPPPPAAHPLPDPAATVAAYATGERLLGPCGRRWPCDAAGPLEELAGVSWCGCGIRVG